MQNLEKLFLLMGLRSITYVRFSCDGLNITGPKTSPMLTSDIEFSAMITLKSKE